MRAPVCTTETTKSEPLFSVVTVCLNARDALLATAESVLEQTMTDFEYIVKDGGSEDGSVQKLPIDKRLRIFAKPDTGIYDAMNQAIQECAGQYIVFMNAGDKFIDKEVLSKVRAYAVNKCPEVMYTDVRNEHRQYVDHYPAQLTHWVLYRRPVCHQAIYVRRDCFARYGQFDASLRIAADYEFLTRLLVKWAVNAAHCGLVGTSYEGNGVSDSPKNRRLVAEEISLARRRNFPFLQRLFFFGAWQVTLPRLRSMVMRGDFGSFFQKAYFRLTNRSR